MAEDQIDSLARTIDHIGEDMFLGELFHRMVATNVYFVPEALLHVFIRGDPRRELYDRYRRFLAEQSARYLKDLFAEHMSSREIALTVSSDTFVRHKPLRMALETFQSDSGDA